VPLQDESVNYLTIKVKRKTESIRGSLASMKGWLVHGAHTDKFKQRAERLMEK
jgi:hypothetical protein